MIICTFLVEEISFENVWLVASTHALIYYFMVAVISYRRKEGKSNYKKEYIFEIKLNVYLALQVVLTCDHTDLWC